MGIYFMHVLFWPSAGDFLQAARSRVASSEDCKPSRPLQMSCFGRPLQTIGSSAVRSAARALDS